MSFLESKEFRDYIEKMCREFRVKLSIKRAEKNRAMGSVSYFKLMNIYKYLKNAPERYQSEAYFKDEWGVSGPTG